jgi:protein involved in polysaccharide export with SLBB domain
LTPYAFTSRADIIRTLPDSSFEFITFNLEDALKDNSTQNVKLMPKDLVRIYSKFDFVDKQFVSIGGFVKEPVTLPYANNLTLLDLLIKSGGLDDPIRKGSTFLQRGDIIRINPDGISSSIIKFNLDSVYYKRISNISLAPGDKVILYKTNVNKVIDEYVSIEGEVFHPGKFKLNKNMTVMDLVLQAGGFTEEAFKKEAYLNRVFVDQSGKEIISESKKIPLAGSFSLNEKSKPDEFLMHKDIVVVRKDPGLEKQRIVKINGEVTFPGVYVLKQRNETVLDLLKEAGGPTSEAFLYGSHFYRGGKRIIVDLESLYRDNDKSANVFLQHQDSIFVPKKPNTILVSGEVNNPGLFKFIPGKSMWDYIDNAGGLSDSADFAVFSLPNGISQRVSLGWFGSNPDVLDGAIINIKKLPPSDPDDKFEWAATIKDIFAIAASVFTILVLVNKL